MRWEASVRWLVAMGLALTICAALGESSADDTPLAIEGKIVLGDVRGRIDHLAVDLGRKRLFVAELGNDSVGVVDLATGNLLQRIGGLREPQGVGYVPSTDTLYVANAGDGSVRLFTGESYTPAGQIELGQDADNIRVDLPTNLVVVGHGAGALAVIDPLSRTIVADIPLKAHPEGFQVGNDTNRIFVNVPNT